MSESEQVSAAVALEHRLTTMQADIAAAVSLTEAETRLLRADIVGQLDQIRREVKAGFEGTNRRLDTQNGRVGKLETRADGIEAREEQRRLEDAKADAYLDGTRTAVVTHGQLAAIGSAFAIMAAAMSVVGPWLQRLFL